MHCLPALVASGCLFSGLFCKCGSGWFGLKGESNASAVLLVGK